MSIGTRFAFFLLAPVLSIAALSAQRNAPPNRAPDSKIDLDVVVTGKSGPPVADLQQQDFTLFDNKSAQPITSFTAVTGGQDIHVFLVVDAINSPLERVAYMRDQMDRFLRANGGKLAEPTALAIVTDRGTQMQEGFSTDGNELSSSLNQYAFGLRDIRRSSEWQANDRFQLSINALRSIAQREANLPGRKLIFWVSPGWPLLSGPGITLDAKQENQLFATIVDFSTQLRQASETLYAIDPLGASEGLGRTYYYRQFLKGVSKPSQVNVGALSLQVLAEQSGGLALSSDNDVAGLLQKCMADTGAYYKLSFTPPRADRRDEYHSLTVQVAKPGMTARTRQGYYAQP
jgi:VWFA-related protein